MTMSDQGVKVHEKWTLKLERTCIDSDATTASNDRRRRSAVLYVCVGPNNGDRAQKGKWLKSSASSYDD